MHVVPVSLLVAREPAPSHEAPPQGASLAAHLAHCVRASGRWFSLHCAVEALHGFSSGRFVTTLALALLVIGSVSALV